MPAASELGLPHTFRPFGVRMAVYVFGGLLVLVTAVIWFTFPGDIRDKFTTSAGASPGAGWRPAPTGSR